MTVIELIEQLRKLPLHAEVVLDSDSEFRRNYEFSVYEDKVYPTNVAIVVLEV